MLLNNQILAITIVLDNKYDVDPVTAHLAVCSDYAFVTDGRCLYRAPLDDSFEQEFPEQPGLTAEEPSRSDEAPLAIPKQELDKAAKNCPKKPKYPACAHVRVLESDGALLLTTCDNNFNFTTITVKKPRSVYFPDVKSVPQPKKGDDKTTTAILSRTMLEKLVKVMKQAKKEYVAFTFKNPGEASTVVVDPVGVHIRDSEITGIIMPCRDVEE